MFTIWNTIIAIVATFAVVQSLLLLLQTWEHCRYCRSSIKDMARHRPRGKAIVFAPCKGADVDLKANLRSLMCQDYDDYEVHFIVENERDPACEAIRGVIEDHPGVSAKVVYAGESVDSGQKVHNLRVATANLADDVEYLAFVDSDAQPRREWLRMLVARLDGKALSVVSGHRWFAPQQASLGNLLTYSINSAMLMLLDRNGRNLIWGGSWAIRRDLFDQVGLRQQWRGTLSDDFVARRALNEAKMPTRFEPAGVVASPLDMRFGETCSFLRRQYLIARCYCPGWWGFGLLCSTITAMLWLLLVVAAVSSLALGSPSAGLAMTALGAVYAIGALRGVVRQTMVWTYFPGEAHRFHAAQLFDIFAGPVTPLANWIAMLSSVVGDRIQWRGMSYRILRGGRIELQTPKAHAQQRPAVKRKQYRRAA